MDFMELCQFLAHRRTSYALMLKDAAERSVVEEFLDDYAHDINDLTKYRKEFKAVNVIKMIDDFLNYLNTLPAVILSLENLRRIRYEKTE